MNDNTLHNMERTNRVITIIGLCFEGLNLFVLWGLFLLFRNFENIFPFSSSWDMDYSEYMEMIDFFQGFQIIFLGIVIFVSIWIVFNLFLFTRLIQGKVKERNAKGVYIYQLVYGILNIGSNQIIGILYLISGIRGMKEEQEETNIRHGI